MLISALVLIFAVNGILGNLLCSKSIIWLSFKIFFFLTLILYIILGDILKCNFFSVQFDAVVFLRG